MHSKGSRFTLWGLGVEGVFARRCVHGRTVRNRPQPFATVRNRPRDPRMAVPMGSSAGGVLFGGFFVSPGGRRGTLRHSDVFYNVWKIVLRGRRNILMTFSVGGALFLAGAALWTYPSSFFVAGAAL